jgi:ribonuclease D
MPPLPSPELVETDRQLKSLIPRLKQHDRLAVDTESNSLYAYQERVCLIQISMPEVDVLVDPLGTGDLSPLGPIFASPKIEKVFHAAEYDLVCLRRDFGFAVQGLYDTRIAARTLGQPLTSLADLLANELDIHLDKRFQRANWGKRPLTQPLLEYARMDSHYLLSLRDRLAQELRDAGRSDEYQEAVDMLACSPAPTVPDEAQAFWGVTNARKLTPEQAAVLRELFKFRDRQARRLDRPPFKVMGDSTLMAIAQAEPVNKAGLEGLPGMNIRQIQRYGEEILAAVARGRTAPHPHHPKTEPADQVVVARYDALRKWRKRVAAERRVESDVILPRDVMWQVARRAPRTLEALQEIMACLPWRYQAYGASILEAVRA